MNIVWLIIMLVSIIVLIFINPASALDAMIKGAQDSVALALNLTALYGIWLGLFEILEQSGVTDRLARSLRPLVRKIFPNEGEEAEKYISMNISANLLGLGNAATPMGIGAVGAMKCEGARASDNMIMLVVISATSLQLFPSTVIGMRASAGSANATDFIIPCIVATTLSTFLGVLAVKAISAVKARLKNKSSLREVTV